MRAAEATAAEIRRTSVGDPWFGPSVTTVLEGVDAATALEVAPGINHSIWQIVLHMGVWARYMTYRVRGGVPREPEEGNWPEVTGSDEAAWQEAVQRLVDSHEELAQTLLATTDEALDEIRSDTPYDSAGEPVTLRRITLAQHTAYHCGQIAIIKQVLGVA